MTTRLGPRYRRLAMAGVGAVIVALIAIACAAPVPDSLVTTANTEAPNHAKASTGYEIVADTFLFTCQDSPEARADTACARGPRPYVNYRGRASDTFVDRDDVEIPSVSNSFERRLDSGGVRPVQWGVEGYRIYRGKEEASTSTNVGRVTSVMQDRIVQGLKCAYTAKKSAGRPVTVADSGRLICVE